VEGTWQRVLITKNGRPAAVLMSPDDLESLLETLAVLSDPETMAAIREAADPTSPRYSRDEIQTAMDERARRSRSP
jgi:antitoxin YefM